MGERVEEGHDVVPSNVVRVRSHDLAQELDLIPRGFGIAFGGLDDLQRMMAMLTVSRGQSVSNPLEKSGSGTRRATTKAQGAV